MIDYHMHLENGPLTVAWLEKFWQQAEKAGLQEIGITEHAHQFREFWPVYNQVATDSRQSPAVKDWLAREFRYDLKEYLDLLQQAKNQGIPVKFGLELDYFPATAELASSILADYEFDFLLGSVHFIEYWPFDFKPELGWPEREIEAAYLSYLALMKGLVQSGLCDVLAHLDVIKVFGHRPEKNLEQQWNSLLEAIAEADLAIEVSTAGWRKPVGELYPAKQIIAKAAELQIPITIASDAHFPEDVGYRWQEAVLYAQQAGYTQYCSFKARQRFSHVLPSF